MRDTGNEVARRSGSFFCFTAIASCLKDRFHVTQSLSKIQSVNNASFKHQSILNFRVMEVRDIRLRSSLLKNIYFFHDDSIRKIQKKIIRLIMFAGFKEHTTPLFIRLSMLQLDDINLQVTALFMFRFFNNMLPDSFNDYFMLNKELHHYNTRLSACVHKNYARTNYSKHLVNYRESDTWNNLPESLREIKSYYYIYSQIRNYKDLYYCAN